MRQAELTLFARLFVALVLAGLSACHGPAVKTLPPRDIYLWKVTHPEQPELYGWILGSVHMTTAGSKLDVSLLRAFEGADALAVEIDLDKLPVRELVASFREHGRYNDGTKLVDHLGDADYARLRKILSARQLVADIEHTQPWVISYLLMLTAPARGGGNLAPGVDRYFLAQAAGVKEVHALETLNEQMTALSAGSETLQLQMLRDTMTAAEMGLSPVEEIVDAYLAGSAEQALNVTNATQKDPELAAFYDRLLRQRNLAMAPRIAELLRRGAHPFVVVGAAHLFGEQGIPSLLQGLGFAVEALGASGELVAIEPPKKSPSALPDLKVVDHHVDWPAPPTRHRVEHAGNTMDLDILQSPPVRYVLGRSAAPPVVVMSLPKLYERVRIDLESQLNGKTAESETIDIAGITADLYRVSTPTLEVLGLSVWAEGTLYSFSALIPTNAFDSNIAATARDVLRTFTLDTRTPQQAQESRDAGLALLRTQPAWLPTTPVCPATLIERANELTRQPRPACAADFSRCLTACAQSNAVACMAAGETLGNEPEHAAVATRLYLQACSLGLVEGCTSEAAMAYLSDARSAEWECAAKTFRLACDKNEPWGCAFESSALWQGRGVLKDATRANTKVTRACELDAAHPACAMSRRLASQHGPKPTETPTPPTVTSP